MMSSFSPVVLALSWVMMSAFQMLQGAVAPGDAATITVSRAAQTPRALGESLGLGEIDFPVSPRSFSLDLLAAEPPPWPDAPDEADKESTAPRKKTPSSMSIAMWFGVLGATLLILPRLRRR